MDTTEFPAARLRPKPDSPFCSWLRDRVSGGHLDLPPSARARVHRFRAGTATLIAIERNVDYQMSEELKQTGGTEILEKPIELVAKLSHLARPVHVYDLRSGQQIGEGKQWRFTLDPWQPSLFALMPDRIPEDQLLATLLGLVRRPTATSQP